MAARLKNVEWLIRALYHEFRRSPEKVSPLYHQSAHHSPVLPQVQFQQTSVESHRSDPPSSTADHVFIEQLLNGVHYGPDLVSKKDVRAFRTGKHWSLLIDEPKDRLIMLGDQEIRRIRISRLPKLPKTFLWLVLTNVKSGLSFECIAKQFGYSANRADSRDNCIHRQKNWLIEKILGSLAAKIFGKCRNQNYPINRHGWTFFWIRKVEDPKYSDLVQRGRGCPTENQ
jgi:hypothetical protein